MVIKSHEMLKLTNCHVKSHEVFLACGISRFFFFFCVKLTNSKFWVGPNLTIGTFIFSPEKSPTKNELIRGALSPSTAL